MIVIRIMVILLFPLLYLINLTPFCCDLPDLIQPFQPFSLWLRGKIWAFNLGSGLLMICSFFRHKNQVYLWVTVERAVCMRDTYFTPYGQEILCFESF